MTILDHPIPTLKKDPSQFYTNNQDGSSRWNL